jgi:zinc transport system permease protein
LATITITTIEATAMITTLWEIFSYPFMLRALIAGLLLALLTSQVGVLSRKLAFLGDTLSHAAFTGIAIGLIIGIHPQITVFAIAILVAFLLTWLQDNAKLSSDTYIAILYSSLLSFGIVLISLFTGFRAELFQYLFGDILAIDTTDIVMISIVTLATIIGIYAYYRPLMMVVIDKDIAQSKGVNVKIYNYIFILLLALTTAVTIKIIGVLLLSSLLVIPAACAMMQAKSLKGAFIYSCIVAELMAFIGLILSYIADTPSGPTMILVGSVFFAILNIKKAIQK